MMMNKTSALYANAIKRGIQIAGRQPRSSMMTYKPKTPIIKGWLDTYQEVPICYPLFYFPVRMNVDTFKGRLILTAKLTLFITPNLWYPWFVKKYNAQVRNPGYKRDPEVRKKYYGSRNYDYYGQYK